MPVYATITMIMFLSSMGLPLLNGFVGEFTILRDIHGEPEVGGLGGTGRGSRRGLFAVAYQRVFFGRSPIRRMKSCPT